MLLKGLVKDDEKMDDAIYDYLLPLSSCDEDLPKPSPYYKALQERSQNMSVNLTKESFAQENEEHEDWGGEQQKFYT